MDKFKESILPLLGNSNIRYLADGDAKSMSAAYFQKSFTRIAATELPHIRQSYFYYQSKENPELVMRFRITQAAGLSAIIIQYSDFKKQFSVLDKL